MTTSQIPFQPGAFTTPVVDYEPPPFNVAVGPTPSSDVAGPAPTSAALHRPRRALRPAERPQATPPATCDVAPPPAPCDVAPPPATCDVAPPPATCDVAPPPAAAAFADAVLRRVLEVIDRRRPIAQLRPMLTPALLDMVFTTARSAGADKAAVLRRVRLRNAAVDAAEVFATYTRGRRVRAIAGRIEAREGRWRMVALQIG